MRFEKTACVAIAVAVVSLAGCSSLGGEKPSTIEDKAAKLLADSEKAISPAPVASPGKGVWRSCKNETPGAKSFTYSGSMQLSVDTVDQLAVENQVAAAWKKAGYWLRAADPTDPSQVAKPTSGAYNNWTLQVQPSQDGQMLLIVDSGCVEVSPSPKTE